MVPRKFRERNFSLVKLAISGTRNLGQHPHSLCLLCRTSRNGSKSDSLLCCRSTVAAVPFVTQEKYTNVLEASRQKHDKAMELLKKELAARPAPVWS